MFARQVSMRLKPHSAKAFTDSIEKEIIPILRKQKGFQDEITFVVPGGTEAVGISLWDQKENAEAYGRGSYAEVQKVLGKVLEGTPRVQSYDVCNSTYHEVAALAPLA